MTLPLNNNHSSEQPINNCAVPPSDLASNNSQRTTSSNEIGSAVSGHCFKKMSVDSYVESFCYLLRNNFRLDKASLELLKSVVKEIEEKSSKKEKNMLENLGLTNSYSDVFKNVTVDEYINNLRKKYNSLSPPSLKNISIEFLQKSGISHNREQFEERMLETVGNERGLQEGFIKAARLVLKRENIDWWFHDKYMG